MASLNSPAAFGDVREGDLAMYDGVAMLIAHGACIETNGGKVD